MLLINLFPCYGNMQRDQSIAVNCPARLLNKNPLPSILKGFATFKKLKLCQLWLCSKNICMIHTFRHVIGTTQKE